MVGIIRRVKLPERVAILASVACTVLAASGLPSSLGLSADDTATLVFAIFGLIATLRGYAQARSGAGMVDYDTFIASVSAQLERQISERAANLPGNPPTPAGRGE